MCKYPTASSQYPISLGNQSNVTTLIQKGLTLFANDSIQSTISHSQQSSIYSKAYTEGSDPFYPGLKDTLKSTRKDQEKGKQIKWQQLELE